MNKETKIQYSKRLIFVDKNQNEKKQNISLKNGNTQKKIQKNNPQSNSIAIKENTKNDEHDKVESNSQETLSDEAECLSLLQERMYKIVGYLKTEG